MRISCEISGKTELSSNVKVAKNIYSVRFIVPLEPIHLIAFLDKTYTQHIPFYGTRKKDISVGKA